MSYVETPEAVVVRLCELVERVAQDHLRNSVPTDCFCGTGGFWFDGKKPTSWRHDDAALRYIEETVDARLAVERRLKSWRRKFRLVKEALRS